MQARELETSLIHVRIKNSKLREQNEVKDQEILTQQEEMQNEADKLMRASNTSKARSVQLF